MKQSVKRLLIITGLLLIFTVVGVSLYIFVKNNQRTALTKELLSIVQSERYATKTDLSECADSEVSEACLGSSFSYLISGLELQLRYLGSEATAEMSKLSDIQIAYKNTQWSVVSEKTRLAIAAKNTLIEQYSKSHLADAKTIKSKYPSVSICNYYFSGKWAVISLCPKDSDTASVILKKGDKLKDWSISSGPGTDFSTGQLSAVSVPDDIILVVNDLYPVTIIPIGNITNTTLGPLSIITNAKASNVSGFSLPNEDLLPFYGKTFSITSQIINNRKMYVVSTISDNEKERESNIKLAKSWLTRNGINPETSPVYYDPLDEDTGE